MFQWAKRSRRLKKSKENLNRFKKSEIFKTSQSKYKSSTKKTRFKYRTRPRIYLTLRIREASFLKIIIPRLSIAVITLAWGQLPVEEESGQNMPLSHHQTQQSGQTRILSIVERGFIWEMEWTTHLEEITCATRPKYQPFLFMTINSWQSSNNLSVT